MFFFLKDTATTEIYTYLHTLSLHDALPIFSPFFSYTESFLPVAGSVQDINGTPISPYRPQTGTQYEAGVKWQPTPNTLVTATAFKIKERNRVLYGAGNSTSQSGELNTKIGRAHV